MTDNTLPFPSPQRTPESPLVPADDQLFSAIFDQSVSGIAVIAARTGQFMRANHALGSMTGYSEQELTQKSLRELIHPHDADTAEEFLRQLGAGARGTPTNEQRWLRRDGGHFWARVIVTPLRDATGAPTCYACLVHDITRHVQAQEALRASEERFRRMLEMSSDWYWAQDAQFRFIELPGFEKRAFSSEVAIGKARWELPDLGLLPERVWEQHRERLRRHEPFFDFTYMRYAKSGELRYLCVSGEPVFDREGKFAGYRGVGRDVTDQVQIQKAIEASEARYRMLFEVHPHPMWVVDSKTLAFLAVNEAAVRHYGYSKEEFLAMTADQIRPPEEVGRLLKAFEDESRAYRHRVWRHMKKNGELIDVEIASFNLEFDGRSARLGVVTDITERLKAQERAQEIEQRYQALLKSRQG